MGIPSYFSWLVRHFEKKIITDSNPYTKTQHLYLDFNCAIHPVARSHPEYTIDQMCEHIVKYLNHIISLVNPTELIYVAIDGVAPVAKMKQQRLRRYKSVKEAFETNQIKQKYGVSTNSSNVDFNMISPCTEFMETLSKHINLFLTSFNRPDLKIIFNDASIPSEGEHKILQHIKTIDRTTTCVIYGLDSDLIMLSMCAPCNNISLLRENTLLKGNNVDLNIDKYPEMNYFIINELKQILFKILISDQSLDHLIDIADAVNTRYDMDSVIKDYIVLSFMLGNDFVPPFLNLKIRDRGIEKVVYSYREILKSRNDYLCLNTNNINMDFFIQLVKLLADHEQQNLQQIKCMHDKKLAMYAQNEPQNYEQALDNYQHVEHMYRDVINPYAPNWQERYYQYYFHIKSKNPRNVTHICVEYIRALHWISKYYFDKCPDWTWYYPYEATPLLSDLVSVSILNIDFIEHQPVNPYQQLMMILPPQSATLLPKVFQPYMLSDYSPIIHYYPIDFTLDYYGHRFRWECHPQIPFINPEELLPIIEYVKPHLTILENSRGCLGKIKTYN